MGFGSVFTAFGVGLFGLVTSLGIFIIELMTSGYGVCRKLMNAYNYRHDLPTIGRTFDGALRNEVSGHRHMRYRTDRELFTDCLIAD